MREYEIKKYFAVADLSGWLSPDEERLIELFRDCTTDDRSEFLFQLTRYRYSPYFAEDFDKEADRRDSTYLYEELEQQLLLNCPVQVLGEFFSEAPHIQHLFSSAWGRIAPVILGGSERDGQNADALFNTAIGIWDSIGDGPHRRRRMDFSRLDALRLIEEWREEVMSLIFRNRP